MFRAWLAAGDRARACFGRPRQTATEATIQLLSSLAAWRHGSLNVMRALARQERAPSSISASSWWSARSALPSSAAVACW
ncbi:hypothetical protein EAD96_15105 [Micromonospora sp. BL1]|nr:hypothetical protein EAD96_15105 [Micromonospora sp. BL1]